MQLRSIRSEDLIEFWSYLSHLVRSKIPLVQALDIVATVTSNKKLCGMIQKIIGELIDGKTFSSALSFYPNVFTPSVIQLIKIAEQMGNYGFIFSRLEEQERWRYEFQSLIYKSLRYPLILMGLMIIFIVLLMGWLIPSLRGYLTILGKKELPFATQCLIYVTECFPFILTGIVLGLLGFFFLSFCRGRFHLKPLKYFFPIFGKYFYSIEILNFGFNLGILLNSKVHVLAALYYSSQSVHCRWLARSIAEREGYLISGQNLSEALIPVLGEKTALTKTLSMGEKTGELGTLLGEMAEFEMKKLQDKLKVLFDYLQPCLIILMGSILAWVVFAIVYPLYDVMGQWDV